MKNQLCRDLWLGSQCQTARGSRGEWQIASSYKGCGQSANQRLGRIHEIGVQQEGWLQNRRSAQATRHCQLVQQEELNSITMFTCLYDGLWLHPNKFEEFRKLSQIKINFILKLQFPSKAILEFYFNYNNNTIQNTELFSKLVYKRDQNDGYKYFSKFPLNSSFKHWLNHPTSRKQQVN